MAETKLISEMAHKKVPPDGGYGWIIMGAYATATMLTVSMMGCFTLIFQETFTKMDMPVSDMSLIFSMNSAFGSLLIGIFNGPLQSTFGYRKMGIVGGALFSFGLFLTSFANSFWQFFFFYGIITSLGNGISFPTFSLAINSFFCKNRRKAIGIGLTIAGLGPIIFPQIIAQLLYTFSTQQCAMLLSAISLHIIVAATLLQPIKWHLKPAESCLLEVAELEVSQKEPSSPDSDAVVIKSAKSKETIETNGSRWEISSDEEDAYLDRPIRYDSIDNNIDAQNIYGFEAVPQLRRHSVAYTSVLRHRGVSMEQPTQLLRPFSMGMGSNGSTNRPRWFESGSANTVNLESSFHIFSEKNKDTNIVQPLSNIEGIKKESNVIDEPTIVLRPTKYKWYESGSQDTVNLGSSVQIFNTNNRPVSEIHRKSLGTIPFNALKIHERSLEILEKIHEHPESSVSGSSHDRSNNNHDCLNESTDKKLPKRNVQLTVDRTWKCIKSFANRLSLFFNFSLLRDPVYVNIMYAMSLAMCAELNFSVLTPTILLNKGLSLSQQATIMSIIAITDVVSRFLSPFLGDKLNIKSSRIMYLLSLTWLLVTRTILIFTSSMSGLVIIGIMLGFGKGCRTVHMSVVVPDYVPIEKLPYAAGIQMMVNSMNFLFVVPLIGLLHDKQGKSFDAYIMAINFVTSCTISMWLLEFYFKKKSMFCFKPKPIHVENEENDEKIISSSNSKIMVP